MVKSNRKFVLFGLMFLFFVILSFYTYRVVREGIHFMLAWNAFLAYIPVLLVFSFNKYQKRFYLAVPIFLIWLFFYPNSLYLITDLIYIDSRNYMIMVGNYQGLTYLRDFADYLAFMHLILGSLFGLVTAIFSFDYFYGFFKRKHLTLGVSYFVFIPIIISIAIYIGRFLRFNSWDVIRVVPLMTSFIESLDTFAWLFIGMFTILQYLVFGYALLMKPSNKKIVE